MNKRYKIVYMNKRCKVVYNDNVVESTLISVPLETGHIYHYNYLQENFPELLFYL